MRNEYIQKITLMLCEEKNPVSIKKIAENVGLSSKSVWNYLGSDEMTSLLQQYLVELKRKAGAGVYLEGNEENILDLKSYVLNMRNQDTKVSSDTLRVLLRVMRAVDYITIQSISRQELIPRNHVVAILDEIDKNLQNTGLSLSRKQNQGILILGDEIKYRHEFENAILKAAESEGIQLEEILNQYEMGEYYISAVNIVHDVQKLIGRLTAESYKEMILNIVVTAFRSQNGFTIKENITGMKEDEFYNFSLIFYRNNLCLNNQDISYIWNKLHSSRFISYKNFKQVDEKLLQVSSELLHSLIDFKDSKETDQLIENLAYHIMQAIYRSQLGIHAHNPMLDSIKKEYTQYYSMVLTNIDKIENVYNVSLNSDEIGYITLYVCTLFEKAFSNKHYNVLLICDDDFAQQQLLSLRIMKEFPNIIIKECTSSYSFNMEKNVSCDFIITTVDQDKLARTDKDCLKISNFFTSDDINQIRNYNLLLNKGLNGGRKRKIMMDIDFKYFTCDFSEKEELLKTFIQIAEQFNYVDAEFGSTVLEREKRAATSIGHGVAIPHGNGNHIYKPALFYIRNKRPIKWDSEEEVDIVLLLIMKFNLIHENKYFFDRMYQSMGEDQMIRKINSAEELEKFREYLMYGDE